MEITICMTSFNRKSQILNTLESLKKYDPSLLKVVLVDDCSTDDNLLTDCQIKKYPFKITYIPIKSNDKWWVNPCFAFDIATRFVDTDVMILQNSECYHYNDILSIVHQKLTPKNYIAFSCYSLPFGASVENPDFNSGMWYCHSHHNPRPLNFCSAIYTNDFKSFGGFDLDFAKGVWYDDDMLLKSMKNAGINISICDDGISLHQWHESNWEMSNFEELRIRNLNILNSK